MTDAKEYLNRIRLEESKLKAKRMELDEVRYLMEGAGAISYERKEGVSGNPNTKSPQEKYYPRYEQLLDEYNEQVATLLNLKRDAMLKLNRLTNANYIDVIYLRYFKRLEWDDIAEVMGYNRRWLLRLHGRALEDMRTIINEEKSH